MIFRDQLSKEPTLTHAHGVFYQRDIGINSVFEKNYLALRDHEGRVYSDSILKDLPYVPETHLLKNEWAVRQTSMEWLISYLKKKKETPSILEIGSGNGWLSNRMAVSLDAEVVAMDVNEHELLQGARVFDVPTLNFVYGDIFTVTLPTPCVDIVVLAGSIQYFPDLKKLIHRLLSLLTLHGEIHLIDSPIYRSPASAKAARARSMEYFRSAGFPEMMNCYFHHCQNHLIGFNHELLLDPQSLRSRLLRRVTGKGRVFPWIVIKHA